MPLLLNHHVLLLLLTHHHLHQAMANLGDTHTSTGGDPIWTPALPAAPYSHPENVANQLYEPSIPGQPIVSEITASSMRLTWAPPLSASTGSGAPPATIQYYRIYQQEYQWTINHKDHSSTGGSTPSDLTKDALRYEEVTYSSDHPHKNDQDVTQLISFPGARNITITFHALTDLEYEHDWIQFLEYTKNPMHPPSSMDGNNRKDLPSEKYSGRASSLDPSHVSTSHSFDSVVYPWPGVGAQGSKPLVIQGDRCLFRFFTDSSVGSGNGTNPNSRWGYSFVAKGSYLIQSPSFIGAFVPVASHQQLSGSKDFPGKYTTQVVNNLKRATSYRFILSARNNFQTDNSTGAWSPLSQPSLRATTLARVPYSPNAAPTVHSVGSTTATVQWTTTDDDGGSPVLGFVLERRDKTCLIIDALSRCTQNNWPKIPGTFVRDSIRDSTAAAIISASSTSTTTSPPPPPPAATLLPLSASAAIVYIPWTSSTMTLSYDIRYLAANVTYEFRVSVTNAVGIGPPSPSSTPTTTAPPQLSLPPTKLSVVSSAFTAMEVTWNAPTDTMGYPLISYELERTSGRPLAGSTQIDYDSSEAYEKAIILSSNVERHTYTGLASGTTYHVRVRAVTSSPLGDSPSTYGASPYSNVGVGSTSSSPTSVGVTPSPPSNVIVQRWDETKNPGHSDADTGVVLRISWHDLTSPMLAVSHYVLYWRNPSRSQHWLRWIEQLANGVQYATFTPTNPVAKWSDVQKYEFVVAGRNSAGSGPHSTPPTSYLLSSSNNLSSVIVSTGNGTTAATNGAVFVQEQHTVDPATDGSSSSSSDISFHPDSSTATNFTIGGSDNELRESINSDRDSEDVVIVNYQSDDGTADDCLTKSGRQTITHVYHDESYGSDIKTIVIDFGFNFDVPPDIERLEIADETLGRVFTLTVNSIWRSRFAITIQRKDLTQGWSNVLKILWRAGAPANYKCSLRGALNMQTRLREGWRLRVVLQTLNANVTGSPINIYRDVTVETDPRLGVVDVTLLNDTTTNTSTTTPARGTIGGSGITVEGMFRISDNAQVKFSRVYLEGGVSGRGGCIYVQHGNLTLNDVVVRRNKALQGGAIYLEEGGRASLHATNSTSFVSNTARTELWDGVTSGGAIYVGRGNIAILRDCLFLENKAIADRATSLGGAIDVWGTLSSVQTRYLRNSAVGPDDGSSGYSDTMSLGAGDDFTQLPSTGSVISTPTGTGSGGAVTIRENGGTGTFLRNEMSFNYASTNGGALFNGGGDVVVRDSWGLNNTARFGASARMTMSASFVFTNSPFLRDDELLYPESAEVTHATSSITDDGRGWPIMSTGDNRPNVKSVYNHYSGGFGCPSGSLDRCLRLCAQNPTVPQNNPSTFSAFRQPALFADCVGTCRAFCTW